MQVVILAGGKGSRAYPFTEYLPKPMMPIRGRPILIQIMRLFAAQGHNEFILSVGHRKDVILDYFANKQFDWDIKIVDTGEDTDTAGRIFNCRGLLKEQFLATYGDGLCDVDINKLIKFHNDHDGSVTLTSVPLKSQYGTVDLNESSQVIGFKEKPVLDSYRINAGFFVINKSAFNHWDGDNLEQEVFPQLTKKNLLYAYNHDGFFKSMDTQKDRIELEYMVREGKVGNINLLANAEQSIQYYDYRDLN